MISHQNVIGQCLQVQQITSTTYTKALAVLPLFHITGLVHSLNLPILRNMEAYMLPSFTMKDMLDAIVKYQISELLLVPPILIRMVRDPLADKYDLLHLMRFSSGAAPVFPEILQLLQQKFPQTGFKQGYGMTESCSCITAHPPSRYDYRYAHTVGAICASTEVKIVDEDGEELDVGQPGELLARGPQVTMGYLGNEKATRENYTEDEFWRTGDQAVIDREGMVTITDRIKEIIKVKGIAVAPAELEDLLLGHPKVEDCAVMGIPDEYSGEKPKAYVVPRSGVVVREDLGKELLKYVKERKVTQKWIKEVEFTDVVPKSASGNILRRVLREKSKGAGARIIARDDDVARARL
jgi:4-coumarate--CoA ligase